MINVACPFLQPAQYRLTTAYFIKLGKSGTRRSPGSYRPHLESGALWQLRGLPEQAFGPLVMFLARISDHPYAAYDRSYLRLHR